MRVSRLCGPGIWSDLDFSNCTLTFYHDPFILLWLVVNTTANLDEALVIDQVCDLMSYNYFYKKKWNDILQYKYTICGNVLLCFYLINIW